MNIMGRQTFLVCLFLVFLIGGVAADSHTILTSQDITGYAIESYEFEVIGKTTQSALRNAIIPSDGDPVWETEDAFMKALNEKRQTLINKQLFLSVEYEYTFTSFSSGIAYYTVTFFIKDSNTLIVLPYPKFDNDETGFLFGVKAKNTNLLGTFGELNFTGYVAQNDGTLESWDDREDFIVLDVTKLLIGESFLTMNLEYLRQKESKPDGEFDYDFKWSDLRLFHTTKLTIRSWGDINPYATHEINYEVGVTGIKVLGTKINVETWGYFKPSPEFVDMNPEEYGLTWTYGPFNQNGGRYSLTNTIEHNSYLTNYYTETILTMHDLNFLTHPFSFNIGLETNKTDDFTYFKDVIASATLGTQIKLPFDFSLSSSVKAVVTYNYNQAFVPYHFEYTNTITNEGRIDYVSHKLRKGLIFSLKHVYHQYPQPEYEDESYWYVENSVTWFPFIIWRFNPSIRINGFYAENKLMEFLPSTTDTDEVVSDYFRGYLSRSPSSALAYAEGDIPWSIIMNLNLTVDFIDFGFAKSYATPFLDVGLFGNPDAPNGYVAMASAGLEGWGVLDRFPSHPVRVALGFNLFDVMDAVEGLIEPLDVEWELSVGFELYF